MFNEHLLSEIGNKIDLIANDMNEMKGDIKVIHSQISGETGIISTQMKHGKDLEDVKKFQWKLTGAMIVVGAVAGWVVKKYESLTN